MSEMINFGIDLGTTNLALVAKFNLRYRGGIQESHWLQRNTAVRC